MSSFKSLCVVHNTIIETKWQYIECEKIFTNRALWKVGINIQNMQGIQLNTKKQILLCENRQETYLKNTHKLPAGIWKIVLGTINHQGNCIRPQISSHTYENGHHKNDNKDSSDEDVERIEPLAAVDKNLN